MRPGVWSTILLMSLLLSIAGLWYAARPIDSRWAQPVVQAGQLIDVNQADAATLMLLPGIGPSLAGRIVSYRQQHGPFGTVQDLANVRGIGPVMVGRLGSLVVCGNGFSGDSDGEQQR